MILRSIYLNQIKDHIDDPMIKVIKGIRRSGKTELLKMIMRTLKKNGIDSDQIIYINYESFDTIDLRDFKELYHHINEICQLTTTLKGSGL